MDQSISLMGELGKAKRIDFSPLQATAVPLPADAVFVIANSLVTSDKQVTAPRNYNLRVAECRLAAKLLLDALALERPSALNRPLPAGRTPVLKDIQDHFGLSFDAMLAAVEAYLHPAPYSRIELAGRLNLSVETLQTEYLSRFPVAGDEFRLYQRAKHVFSEAKRVFDFQAVCALQGPDALAQLGRLMDESQASCDALFDCSCPELDSLTALARAKGAEGSRLTGAGWGGCTVSLVRSGTEGTFIPALLADYFPAHGGLQGHAQNDVVFATVPGSGACIVEADAVVS